MKNRIYFFLFVSILFSLPVLAQKKFSEGTVSYDIVINTGSDKPKSADFMDGTTDTNYIKGDKTHEIKMKHHRWV